MKIKIETHVYKNGEGVMSSIGRDQVGNQYHIMIIRSQIDKVD